MTAKEIADALRTAKALDWDALRVLEEYRAAKAANGAPTVLEYAVITAADECNEALRHLKKRLEHERKERDDVLRVVTEVGARFEGSWSDLVEQNNHTTIVAHEVYKSKRKAFLALLDVFAAIGDRIVATPEEAEAARAEQGRRALARRKADIEAWLKLDLKSLAGKAEALGVVAVDARKADIASALVDAGHKPS